jgi:hypothetical protein
VLVNNFSFLSNTHCKTQLIFSFSQLLLVTFFVFKEKKSKIMSRGMDFWDVFTTQVEKNLFQKKFVKRNGCFPLQSTESTTSTTIQSTMSFASSSTEGVVDAAMEIIKEKYIFEE